MEAFWYLITENGLTKKHLKLQNTVANKKDLLAGSRHSNQVVDGNFLELNNFYNFKLSLIGKLTKITLTMK